MTDTDTVNTAAPSIACAASWETDRLDPRVIERSLRTLWGDLAARSSTATPGATVPDQTDLRTSTVNLIVVTDTATSVTRLEEALFALHTFAPSRVLVLNLDAARPAGGFQVDTALRELPTERGRMPIRFETVRVTACVEQEVSLASIASPLLLPELPTFLYWPGTTLVESPLFHELIPIADRLMIDSSLFLHGGVNLREIGRLIGNPRGPVVSDFAWRRLTPWRSLLAQFFNLPEALPELERIEEVELIGRLAGKNGQSGMTATLLLAGWLASTLNWRAPGPMVQAKQGWRVTLRCGSGLAEREVVLRTRLKAQTKSPGRVLSVMLRSDEAAPQPALFRVERVSQEMVRTYSEFGGKPPVSRGVPASVFDDSDLLSKELASLGRDTVYESALQCAVTLMPEESPLWR